MADNIHVPIEVLRQRATEYRTEADNVDAIITKMTALLSSLQCEWEGQASKIFDQDFSTLKPSFEAARDVINGFANKLDAVANNMEQSDIDNANIIAL